MSILQEKTSRAGAGIKGEVRNMTVKKEHRCKKRSELRIIFDSSKIINKKGDEVVVAGWYARYVQFYTGLQTHTHVRIKFCPFCGIKLAK